VDLLAEVPAPVWTPGGRGVGYPLGRGEGDLMGLNGVVVRWVLWPWDKENQLWGRALFPLSAACGWARRRRRRRRDAAGAQRGLVPRHDRDTSQPTPRSSTAPMGHDRRSQSSGELDRRSWPYWPGNSRWPGLA